MAKSSTRVIAVEEHFSTNALLDRTASMPVFQGEEPERDVMAVFSVNPEMRRRVADLDTRIAEMGASGTDLAILSFNPPGAQMYSDGVEASGLARDANDILAEIIRARPNQFAGLGALALQQPSVAAQEVRRVMGSLGFGGIMITSHTNGCYLDDPAYEPILAAIEEEDATLYLHPRVPSPAMLRPFRDYGMLGAVWGFQAEAGVHAVRLILAGVFDRHPNLRVVLGHLGEALPLWLWRLDNIVGKTQGWAGGQLGMPKLQLKPSEYFRRNFWVTTSGMSDDAPFAFCLERLGAEKILFAIDYPFEESAVVTSWLKDAAMTDEQRTLVSHRNAERLFRIDPVVA